MPTRSPSLPDRAPRDATVSPRPSWPRLVAVPKRALPSGAPARAELARRARTFVVALCLVAPLACKRGATSAAPPAPPLIPLGAVTVHDLTPPAETPAHLDVAALGRSLRARLLATRLFAGDPADG